MIRERLQRRLHVPTIPVALQRLARRGFSPESIFDVGAYRGDFARLCVKLWPRSHVASFEPLPHRVSDLMELARQHPAMRVFPCLLGSRVSSAVILHEAETASSVLEEHCVRTHPTRDYSMRTVDDIVAREMDGRGPDLLKLDVQGFELEVLKGTEKSLGSISMILMEVNFLDLHIGVPLLADVIKWLNDRGWVAYDICGLMRRPLDQALWQADFLFVPEQSPLRADKRWSA